jgi:hypothetical protein
LDFINFAAAVRLLFSIGFFGIFVTRLSAFLLTCQFPDCQGCSCEVFASWTGLVAMQTKYEMLSPEEVSPTKVEALI